jgi:hypothetical protein
MTRTITTVFILIVSVTMAATAVGAGPAGVFTAKGRGVLFGEEGSGPFEIEFEIRCE